MRALTLTLLSALLPLVAAALCLGGYLNFASVRANYLELVDDRLAAAARRISSDAHTALSLGLPLAGQVALGRSLEREAAADPVIGRMDVVGASGTVLFSSDPAEVGRPFDFGDSQMVVRQAPIVSMFGTIDGAVLATASRARVDAELGRVGRVIAMATAMAVLIGALAIAGLVAISVRALGARLTAHRATSGGRLVPADMAATLDTIEAAHRPLADRLGVRLGDG